MNFCISPLSKTPCDVVLSLLLLTSALASKAIELLIAGLPEVGDVSVVLINVCITPEVVVVVVP